jgi:hypothetical protein
MVALETLRWRPASAMLTTIASSQQGVTFSAGAWYPGVHVNFVGSQDHLRGMPGQAVRV